MPNVSSVVSSVKLIVNTNLPTAYGEFQVYGFLDEKKKEHLALIKGDVVNREHVLCRVHSECLTSEVFYSLRCDCREQLENALSMIQEREGIFIYLRQEGRDIGLFEKLKTYNLQYKGLDTYQANVELGHAEDARDYGTAAQILTHFNIVSICLLSNNPDKKAQLEAYGITIDEQVPIVAKKITRHNRKYLLTKAEKKKHTLGFL